MKHSTEWRHIENTTYYVSNTGKVKRVGKRVTKIQKNYLDKSVGYETVGLSSGGKTKTYKVHSLVAGAFLGKRPDGMQVNHIDGNKRNNDSSNLEYITPKENTNHAIRIGIRQLNGESNGNAKLTTKKVSRIKAMISRGLKAPHIALVFGVHRRTIAAIKYGVTWKEVV